MMRINNSYQTVVIFHCQRLPICDLLCNRTEYLEKLTLFIVNRWRRIAFDHEIVKTARERTGRASGTARKAGSGPKMIDYTII